MAFTIPTYFTAVDQITPTMRGMGASLEGFAMKAERGLDRSERAFRKLTPALGDASKQMLSMVGTAAITAGIFAGGAFSVKSIMDYETELANLQAVTGASGKDFDTFKGKIKDVAIETQTSSVAVAKAFTAIANNQPELLKNADALAMVTKSSIILAQASKMELQPAGEALTQILNQYGKGAAEAARTVDILAAGSVAGSSEIRDTADAIQKFGTVAANAGIKINESVALVELSSKFEKGAEAGQKLRNILIMMSTAKVQDPKAVADMKRLGVNMDVVSDKALPLSVRLKEMAKVAHDDAAVFHIFGKENQALATGVLSTADNFNEMLKAVETSGMAQKMADKNNSTLAISLERLKDRWVTLITTSDSASSGLNVFNSIVQWLSKNLDTVVTIGASVLTVFGAWWALMKVVRISLIAYNVGLGIYNALTGTATVYTEAQTIASGAQAVATGVMTAAQWALNVAMDANPIGLVIVAVAALAAGIMYLKNQYDSLIAEMESAKQRGAESAKKALNNEVERLERTQHLSEKEARQQAYMTERKIALKNYEQARLAEIAAKENTGIFGMSNLDEAKAAMENRMAAQSALIALSKKDVFDKPGGDVVSGKPAIDLNGQRAQATAQTVTNNMNKNLTIDFKNVPKGVDISGDTGADGVTPSTSSTMKQ
jgi:TP901 family phage tail tape measure protein